MRVDALSKLALKALAKQISISSKHRVLDSTSIETEYGMSQFYNYFRIGGNYMTKLAKECHYHLSQTLSLLFLPFLFYNGSLVLSDESNYGIMKFVNEMSFITPEMCSKLHNLILHRWCSLGNNVDLDVAAKFFSKMNELRIVILCNDAVDEFLLLLAKCCPKLQVIDCRDDCWCAVTDKGLKALANLKELQYILFNSLIDEFDEEDEKLLFTPQGIASLVPSLPHLKKFECPEYMFREALDILKSSHEILPTMKSVHMAGKDSHAHTYRILNGVCPNLEELSILVHEGEESVIGEALTEMKHLKKLTMVLMDAPMSRLKIDSIAPNLKHLIFKKHEFLFEDLILLGSTCVNLDMFYVEDQCVFNRSFEHKNVSDSLTLFPSLNTFVFQVRDRDCLITMLPAVSNITMLFVKGNWNVIDDDRPINEYIEKLIKTLENVDVLPNIVKFVIPGITCSSICVTRIIDALPSLKYLNIGMENRDDVVQYLITHKRYVEFGIDGADELCPPENHNRVFDLS